MRGRGVTLAVALLLALGVAVPVAGASGPTADQCAQVDQSLATPCYGIDVVQRDAGATVDPHAHDAEVAAYEGSWAHRALGLQYALANDLGTRDAPWVGTHNSFNSIAEMGTTVSDTDSNQQLSLTDQLRLDVRSLELDLHWWPSLAARGASAPVVCHAQGAHEGCSIEKPLGPVLDEIGGWLRAHPGQVLLLYAEDHLDGAEGYDAGAATIADRLGPLLYRPTPPASGSGCAKLPPTLSRDDVLAAGAQVVIVSDCGVGTGWPSVVFDWSDHVEDGNPTFRDYPDCGPDYDRATYDAKLVRFYEDSTWLSAAIDPPNPPSEGITPATAAAMARCGADLIGFDQLLPGDGRLPALVWSWAQDEPRANAGDCAKQGAGGRWRAVDCQGTRRVACRTSAGAWVVPPASVPQREARWTCLGARARFAAPRTGYENQRLREAAAGAPVWLGLERRGGRWTALDRR